jgi:hypothetical protein
MWMADIGWSCDPPEELCRICRVLHHGWSKPVIPESGHHRAKELLASLPHACYVGLNLVKYGSEFLHSSVPIVRRILIELLKDPSGMIIDLSVTRQTFPHWPEPERSVIPCV